MIVTLMDGDTLRTNITNCTGYVAKRIEIEAKDVRHLSAMLERDPASLRATLAQLQHRFPEERAPYKGKIYPHQQATLDFLNQDGTGGMFKLFGEGYRRHGKRPELAMGYGMSPARNDRDQIDVYRAMFPEIAGQWKRKPDHRLRNWFWFWFTFIFLFFG